MQPHHLLFDTSLYRTRKQRRVAQFAQHDFLHVEVEARIGELLDTVQRHFAHVVVLGSASDALSAHPRLGQVTYMDRVAYRHVQVVCEEEWLPLAEQSVDAIISVLHLHHVNDVAGTLLQMQRALTPDGLLVVVVMGARSGSELRNALEWAEMQQGGISPRIAPLMDIRDAGALLQRAGLQLPVVESELLTVSYADMFALLHEIRGAGESNILRARSRHMSSRELFAAASAYYDSQYGDAEGRIPATIELLTLTGWKAHAAQQQPAVRGSGQVSLKNGLE